MTDSSGDDTDVEDVSEQHLVTEQWVEFSCTDPDVKKNFRAEKINGKKTKRRRCERCKQTIVASNRGTSNLAAHLKTCLKKTHASSNQPAIDTVYKANKEPKKGLTEVAKLVYEDNIPINKIANSKTLQSLFKRQGWQSVTYSSLDEELDRLYAVSVAKIKQELSERAENDFPVMAFDKWTAMDNSKFIGVYLYTSTRSYCLGVAGVDVPLKLELANKTRWNSTLSELERFCQLRLYLEVLCPELKDFDWHTVSHLISVLKPLKDVTLDLQKSSANVETIVDTIEYLRLLANEEISLTGPITEVLNKHVEVNPVVIALIENTGPFYNFLKTKLEMSQAAKRRREEAEGGNPVPSTDHRYTAGSSSTMSLMAFKKNKKVNTKTGGFTVSAVMRNLRPSTADPERLFSFGRLSKNYLQTRLTPEHHDRNVFLNKNSHIL